MSTHVGRDKGPKQQPTTLKAPLRNSGPSADTTRAGGSGVNGGEVPLLVPLLHGAATNMSLGEDLGAAQEALVERYLALLAPLAPDMAGDGGGGGGGAVDTTMAQQLKQLEQLQQHRSGLAPGVPGQEEQLLQWERLGWGAAQALPTMLDPQRLGALQQQQQGRLWDQGLQGLEGLGWALGADPGLDSPPLQRGERGAAGTWPGFGPGGAVSNPPGGGYDGSRPASSLSHRSGTRDGGSGSDGRTPEVRAGGRAAASSAMEALGVDRATLRARGVPEHQVRALHAALAGAAAAFFRTVVSERRRLAVLAAGSGPEVPLADRMLAFVTGVEGQLARGSALPDVEELRDARAVQGALDAVMGGPGVQQQEQQQQQPQPYHHELVYEREQQLGRGDQPQGEAGRGAPGLLLPPGTELLSLKTADDVEKITALAAAGNVAGLRLLLRNLVGAAEHARGSLGARAEAEAARATREVARAEEARREAEGLRRQLEERDRMLAERGSELSAALVRAAAAEGAAAADRGGAAALRGELRQLAAEYEQHHAELKAKMEAEIAELQRSLHAPDDLGPQLAAARSALALSQMGCAQERAVAGQLRVMLAGVQGTVELHRKRAEEAVAEVDRLSRLSAAVQDLANANTGGLATLEQQLARERAAHRRTTERLQAVNWKVEQARCCVADTRARAAHALRELKVALADTNLRAVSAERQVADKTLEVRGLTAELEAASNTAEALRDKAGRLEADVAALRSQLVAATLDGEAAASRARGAEAERDVARATVSQLQQQVAEEADAVLAGRAAAKRLTVLEPEHASLLSAHEALVATHGRLSEEAAAMRARLTELERQDALLVELTARWEELLPKHQAMEADHELLKKAHADLAAQLAASRRQAHTLMDQMQAARQAEDKAHLERDAEMGLRRAAEAERDALSAERDELAARVEAQQQEVEQAAVRVSDMEAEVGRCRRAVALAEQQRAEAFAMRDAWTRARLLLSSEVREYLSSLTEQAALLAACLDGMRGGLAGLQGRLLDVSAETLEGVAAPRTVPFEDAMKVCDALFRMVSHSARLVETQEAVRSTVDSRLQAIENGLQERLSSASDYWRQVLVISKNSPRAMVQVVERMTGQVVRDLELDPLNPLSRMIPIGVLEEAGSEMSQLHERLGVLRGATSRAQAEGAAALQLLEHERQVSAARACEFQSLVEELGDEIRRLRRQVGSLEASTALQAKATADMQRMLSDAEWKVSKAQEREALAGIKFMVPLGRTDRAVQTVYSDLYMLTMAHNAAALQVAASPPVLRQPTTGTACTGVPQAAQGLQGVQGVQSSGPGGNRGSGDGAGGDLDEKESGALGEAELGIVEDHGGEVELDGLKGGLASEGGWPAAAVAAEAGSGARGAPVPPLQLPALTVDEEASGTPGSLPPLSALPGSSNGGLPAALSSPAGSPRQVPSPGTYTPLQRPSTASTAAAAGPTRPQSHLARGTPSASVPAVSVSSPLRPALTRPMSAMPGSGSGGALSPSLPGGRSNPNSPRSARGGGQASLPGGLVPLPRFAAGAAGGGGGSHSPHVRRHPLSAQTRGNSSVSGWMGAAGSPASPGTGASSAATASDGGAAVDEEGGARADAGSAPSLSTTAAIAAAFRARSDAAEAEAEAIAAAAARASSRPPSAAILRAAILPSAPSPSTSPPRVVPITPVTATAAAAAAPPLPTASGVPHAWQAAAEPWDWLPAVVPMTRTAVPYSRQQLLDLIADVYQTKGLHDQVAAAAAFPPASLQSYIGAYFEARHGPRGGVAPAAEAALAQLLVSLEAHSALYDVMLFTRVAGLHGWNAKGGGPNSPTLSGCGATSRPASARPPTASGGASSPASPQHRSRPGSCRPQHGSTAAGGGALGSPRSPAAGGGAAAARSRAASARSVGGGSGRHVAAGTPLDLSLVPSPGSPSLQQLKSHQQQLRPVSAYGSPASVSKADADPAGECTLRLRTGQPPSLSVPPTVNGHAASAELPGPSLADPGPAPTRVRVCVNPDALVSEALDEQLRRLGTVAGMKELAEYLGAGRLAGRFALEDLGEPLPEEQHPALHYLVAQVTELLGLPQAPELLRRQDGPPHGSHAALLQLPAVATSSLGLLAADDANARPPSAHLHRSAPASTPGGGGGSAGCSWQRRAVLLLSPALVEAAEAAAEARAGGGLEELQAVVAAALGPMLMPGGYGWRYDVGDTWAGPQPAAPRPHSASPGRPGSPPRSPPGPGPVQSPPAAPRPLLSAAEVVTAVHLAAMKPRAVAIALPSQLQVKWERLHGELQVAAGAVLAAADRAALLAAQGLAVAARATYRAATGLGVRAGLAGGEELVVQAQAMPWGEKEAQHLAAMAPREVAGLPPGDGRRHAHALARVLGVAHWAESQAYRLMLRNAVLST